MIRALEKRDETGDRRRGRRHVGAGVRRGCGRGDARHASGKLHLATQAGTQAATQADPAPVDLPALAKMLGSDDYAVRQSAAEILDGVDASRRNELEALAVAAADPEVKAGLWQRLNAIDDALASNPTPIYIQLDNASAGSVAEALNQQLQMPFGFEQRTDDKTQRYTLAATDASYWDVIAELNDQHPLMVVRSDSDDRTVLREMSPRDSAQNVPLTYRVHKEGLAVLPMPVRKNGNGAGAQYIFQCGVTADPRMTVLCHTMPIVRQITDDQGNRKAAAERQCGQLQLAVRSIAGVVVGRGVFRCWPMAGKRSARSRALFR